MREGGGERVCVRRKGMGEYEEIRGKIGGGGDWQILSQDQQNIG